MNRRTFLRLAASAGLAVTSAPLLRPGTASANVNIPGGPSLPPDGPFWVTMHAGGGWDPTLLCDPKGRISDTQTDPINNYRRDDIEEVGPFRLAPIEGNRAFFERWGSEVLVINGIDTGTNSHETGVRHIWSGGFGLDMPAISALIASAQAEHAPSIAFLSYGGYDQTAGLVPRTRLPDVSAIDLIASPAMISNRGGDNNEALRAGAADSVARARIARMERQIDNTRLHREHHVLSVLHNVRTSNNDLDRLQRFLPENLDDSDNPLARQAQVACAAFRAGLTVSANLSTGGFDTHGNHDQNHIPRLVNFLQGVDFLLQEADRQGILDRLNLVVGSDFARTPWYNAGNGKDHWSITSMMFVGPNIRGGRVIGATDDGQRALRVDAQTLATADNGVRLAPGHVHAAMRNLAGIDEHQNAQRFSVPHNVLPLFG